VNDQAPGLTGDQTRHAGGFVWVEPPDALIARARAYGERVKVAVYAVAEYMAQVIVDWARRHASWTDRTGNARAALHAIAVWGGQETQRYEGPVPPEAEAVVEVASGLVAVYLSHGVSYGKYLETIRSGKWAIILPALEAHYGQVMDLIREVLA
jgi:hypothetical protein